MSVAELVDWEGGGRIWATEAGREVLESLHYRTVDDIRSCVKGDVVVAGRHRTVRRIDVAGRAVYLKQSFRGGSGDVLRGFLRTLRRRSSSRREWEHFGLLRRAGVGTAEPLAVGEMISGFREVFSFIITLEAPGTALADYVVTRDRLPTTDLTVENALVSLVERLFDAGLYLEDLVPKHIFLETTEDGVATRLIDVHRLRGGKRRDAKTLASCLARLSAALPIWAVSTARRIRFLRRVGEACATDFVRPTVAEVRALQKRRRYRPFLLSRRPREMSEWRRSSDGRVLFDPHHPAAAGAGGPSPGLPIESRGAAVRSESRRIRELLGLLQAVRGQLRTVELVACCPGPDEEGGGWIWLAPTEGRRWCDAVENADEKTAQRLVDDAGDAFSTLAFLGFLPTRAPLAWLEVVEGDVVVVPRLDGVGGRGVSSGERETFRAVLEEDVENAGLSRPVAERLLAAAMSRRPGFLGAMRG